MRPTSREVNFIDFQTETSGFAWNCSYTVRNVTTRWLLVSVQTIVWACRYVCMCTLVCLFRMWVKNYGRFYSAKSVDCSNSYPPIPRSTTNQKCDFSIFLGFCVFLCGQKSWGILAPYTSYRYYVLHRQLDRYSS